MTQFASVGDLTRFVTLLIGWQTQTSWMAVTFDKVT